MQHWRKKAEELRKSLGLQATPKAVSTPTPKVKDDKAEPIDLAAHLQLLGESLGTIGACLRVQVSRTSYTRVKGWSGDGKILDFEILHGRILVCLMRRVFVL